MRLTDPFWLILIIPLAMSLWMWPPSTRLFMGLRICLYALLVLAICGLGMVLPARSGTLVLVMDRSLSMPPGSDDLHKEAAALVDSKRQAGDKLAVISFADNVALEQPPQEGKFAGFSATMEREGSRLADAIDMGLSLIGKHESGRLLVLSDGRSTGRDMADPTARAVASGVPIDYRAIERPISNDLAIERVSGPESVLPSESFMLTAWVFSPRAQEMTYELNRNGTVIARGKQTVEPGTNRLIFRDTATSGVQQYRWRIQGEGTDPLPENNQARLLVGTSESKPILCVNPKANSSLPQLLERGGLSVRQKRPKECPWTLEELASYSAVILENTRADSIGLVGMQNLASWIEGSGGGLMITGGRSSYGPGGYYKSPLEPLFPVSMELRREHRKLSLAIVVALDRSGSMAAPVGGGHTKMDLANLATAEVIELLGPNDQFGCIAVDSAPHLIVPLSDVENKAALKNEVLQIDSLGGGIFVYEALAAAAKLIEPATAATKHIILFSDAADSENPDNYKSLIEACIQAGITISVVGLGNDTDVDAALLKDIGRLGNGQTLFTNVPHELPRLFAQDMFQVARSTFLDGVIGIEPTAGLTAISQKPFSSFPTVGGYNLCYLRPAANLAVISKDEYQAPIVASWQAGLGRVLCYTGEADGKDTGAIAKWQDAGAFFVSLARWTSGDIQPLGSHIVATQELINDVCRVEVHLDPDRESSSFDKLPTLNALIGRPGDAARSKSYSVQWSSADTLRAEIPLTGSQTVLPTLAFPGIGAHQLSPVCLPYSTEYLPQREGSGANVLERLARATGGKHRVDLGGIWDDMLRGIRMVSLAPLLLLISVLLLVIEVIERRTALISSVASPLFGWVRSKTTSILPPIGDRRSVTSTVTRATQQRENQSTIVTNENRTVEKKQEATPPPIAAGDLNDALQQARLRAQRRTKRD